MITKEECVKAMAHAAVVNRLSGPRRPFYPAQAVIEEYRKGLNVEEQHALYLLVRRETDRILRALAETHTQAMMRIVGARPDPGDFPCCAPERRDG